MLVVHTSQQPRGFACVPAARTYNLSHAVLILASLIAFYRQRSPCASSLETTVAQ